MDHIINRKTYSYAMITNLYRKRFYLPGLLSAGKPNDYINMFLEEMKSWLRTQLTLDVVNLEELRKRSTFIKKLKHDKYYWYGICNTT